MQNLRINFTKLKENNIEAKSQLKVFNKLMFVVISSKGCLWSIHFQDLVKKIADGYVLWVSTSHASDTVYKPIGWHT